MNKRSRERRNRFFSAVARFYQPGLDFWTGGAYRGFHGEVVEELDLRPGLKVLDLGCGAGRIAKMTAEKLGNQGEVTGVDASENMIRIARTHAGGFSNLTFIHSDIEHYEPEKGGVDRVIMSLFLHEVSPEMRRQALEKSYLALKSGGSIVIGEFGNPGGILGLGLNLFVKLAEDYSVPDFIRQNRVELLQNHGFSRVREKPLFRGVLSIISGWKICPLV